MSLAFTSPHLSIESGRWLRGDEKGNTLNLSELLRHVDTFRKKRILIAVHCFSKVNF